MTNKVTARRRAEASGWATLDSLPGVVSALSAQVPVMMDSGFRRGTDIYKARRLIQPSLPKCK